MSPTEYECTADFYCLQLPDVPHSAMSAEWSNVRSKHEDPKARASLQRSKSSEESGVAGANGARQSRRCPEEQSAPGHVGPVSHCTEVSFY